LIYLLPTGIQKLDVQGNLVHFPIGQASVEYSSLDFLRTLCGDLTWRGKHFQCTGDIFISIVAAEFYRNFDSRYPEWKIPRYWKKEMKSLVRTEADLWFKAWECLERMNSLGAWSFPIPTTHPAIGLASLIGEMKLLNFLAYPEDGHRNMTTLIRSKQSETQKMRTTRKSTSPKNPFESGFTKLFVDTSIELAKRLDGFDRDRWTPFLEARSDLIKAWRHMKPEFVDEKTGVPLHGKSISSSEKPTEKGFQSQNTLHTSN
jgi:hypothetical protein